MSVKFIKPIEEIDEEFIKTHFRQDFIIVNHNVIMADGKNLYYIKVWIIILFLING